MATTLAVFWISFREKLMITVAKHAIILVIIRSLATPYAGPHKLFKMFLKLPRCFVTVAERKQSGVVISGFQRYANTSLPWDSE
jgi:hypothetical protein